MSLSKILESILSPFLTYFIGFGAYFGAIYIRRTVFPGINSPPLAHQFLLGIPFSLGIVPTFISALKADISNIPLYLITLGFIMEQGLILQETATRRIQEMCKKKR